ncbi:MAG TPA: DUF167 family protein [Acidimicrobiia bacterium]|nr:DUF167 family protein [Acidimicrobiia bacterium]
MENLPVIAHRDGVLIKVWAVPRASRTEIAGWHGGRVRIRVTAPPEGGRANQQVSLALSERLGSPVELISGGSARGKVFLARALEVDEVLARLPR